MIYYYYYRKLSHDNPFQHLLWPAYFLDKIPGGCSSCPQVYSFVNGWHPKVDQHCWCLIEFSCSRNISLIVLTLIGDQTGPVMNQSTDQKLESDLRFQTRHVGMTLTKAEALFHLTEFEQALLHFHNGLVGTFAHLSNCEIELVRFWILATKRSTWESGGVAEPFANFSQKISSRFFTSIRLT